MAKKVNYIIGHAEKLTDLTPPPRIDPKSEPLYTFEEAKSRLKPQLKSTSDKLQQLPDALCPRDFAVSELTLHPSYIAKGHFPKKLFKAMGLRSVGSKGVHVLPDRWTRKGQPKDSPTTKVFVAGKREQLTNFYKELDTLNEDRPESKDLHKIWNIDVPDPKTKLKIEQTASNKHHYYEIGLQLIPDNTSDFIKTSFLNYLDSLEVEYKSELIFQISNLVFLPIFSSRRQVEKIAEHPFVRVIRNVPKLRAIDQLVRATNVDFQASLPNSDPLSSDIKVGILDGGLPTNNSLSRWIKNYHLAEPTAKDYPEGPLHGLGVTSAFLFGPLSSNSIADRPFSHVNHHRILDSSTEDEDPLELYRTLGHIEDILLSRQYEFINLSLGPELSIDDDEIHPWTSLIDSYLSDGETIMTIAAGNNGQLDEESELNRVQIPSDCVNAITVGATDSQSPKWNKADYSAIGPGRAPGRVKPDIVAFGGSNHEYFHVVNDNFPPQSIPTAGTSFASPLVLRQAVGVRAIMGHDISPIAIKALLIHSSEQHNDLTQTQMGWGRINNDIRKIIESPDGVARILYQGELNPGKYLRVPLPIPREGVKGKLNIKATCCIATPVDPQDTSMYTKAGVGISWRPKKGKSTEPFFQQKKFATEAELRSDAGKWESVLHNEKGKLGSSLNEPEFTIHYMARDGGGEIPGYKAPTIKYAFVVTIESPKHPDIFEDILKSYPSILTELQPIVSIPTRVET